MSKEDRIIIVGAGIGGLSAGLCLEKAGFEVQLIERFDEVREVGAGILLAPNASAVHYERLGLGAKLDAVSAPLTHASIGTWRGNALFEYEVSDEGFPGPIRMIHRAALQRVLYEALGPDKILLSSPASGFEVDDDGVCAITEDGRKIKGRALIGADGVHSVSRRQLLSDTPDPLRYHGYTCWRGITEPFAHDEFRRGTLQELQGKGARIGIGYIDEERIYWWATYDTPEGGKDDRATIHDDLLSKYADFPDYFLAMLKATPTDKILRNDIYDRRPLHRWGTGAMTLLGDAAHPMAPNLGQGACSAVEDADMLALCLKKISGVEKALRRYENLRKKRTEKLQKLSRRFGSMGQWHNPLAVKIREWSTATLAPLTFDNQQNWLWDYDAARELKKH